MLPFLRNRMEGSVSAEPESMKREPDEEGNIDALEEAMRELFKASSDKERAAAFRAAFELLELEPHAEGPHNG